jgi:hypothetical protein
MACKPPGCRQPRQSLQSATPDAYHLSGARMPGARGYVPSERRRSLPRLVHALSASSAHDGQPEGMTWAHLVLSLLLHQTPRYGDRCSLARCQAKPQPAAACSFHGQPPSALPPPRPGVDRERRKRVGPDGSMGHRSHGRRQGAPGACGSKSAPRWPWRACPAVWVFRGPLSSSLAADDGLRMPALAGCEKARGWHKAQELTWRISRAVIAEHTGCPSGRCPRPGKDPS